MKRLLNTTVLAIIISAALPVRAQEATANRTKGKVLLVASSTNTLGLKGGKVVPTGYFLDELAVPAQYLIANGYEVVVATPDGNTPAMDAKSNHVSLFRNDQNELQKALGFVLTHPTMQKPLKLRDIVQQDRLTEYEAVFVPGGHAPMNDLMQDADFGRVLRHFHDAGKPTALICHGPVALLAALPAAGAYRAALVAGDANAAKAASVDWPYAGYRMTIYSNSEERPIEDEVLKGKLQFYVADALRGAGGKVEHAADNTPFVVRDRELITAQNPASDHRIAEALVDALDRARAHGLEPSAASAAVNDVVR